MRPIQVEAATDVDHALALLDDYGSVARPYSGGVELVPTLMEGTTHTEVLVDVKHLPGARGITVDAERVRLGAAVTHRWLSHSHEVAEVAPALSMGAKRLGNPRVRATGTLGGNLAARRPDSDIALLLAAYEAELAAATRDGVKQYAADQWLDIPDEPYVLTEIVFPVRPERQVSYHRFPRAGTPLAAVCTIEHDGRTEVVLGCAGDELARLDVTELRTEPGALRDAVVDAGHSRSTPVASADYRRHLLGVLTERALVGRELEEAGS